MKKFQRIIAFSVIIASFTAASLCVAAEKKVFRVGMECASAPYNWSQPDPGEGTVQIAGSSEYAYGYDIIIAQKLADAMGVELEVHKIEWEGLPPAVVSGKIDAAMSAMSITEQRKLTVDFTLPYYYANVVGVVRRNSPQAKATCVADLRGSKATSQINTIWYDKVDQIPDVKKLPPLADFPSLFVALKSGKCDVVIVDEPCAMGGEYANPELMMLDLPADKGFKASREDVEIGIAVQKGNTELVEAMNKVLGKMTDADFKAIMEEAIKRQPLTQVN